MNINLDALSKMLPPDESFNARNQRELIWALWDKNENGFLSLTEVEEGLCEILQVESSLHFKGIVTKSSDDVKRKYRIRGKFGQNYLEKKEFRGFV